MSDHNPEERHMTLKVEFSLSSIMKEWSRQLGLFSDKTVADMKGMEAMSALFSIFASNCSELSDTSFMLIFRFFVDMGLTKRLSSETSVYQRYSKIINNR